MKRQDLKKAIDFHGHLGPYLVLGMLAGEYALKNLKCQRHFGLEVRVWGADKKPKSCFIDGLQLSTGATYGKGNIRKINSAKMKVLVRDLKKDSGVTLVFKDELVKRLDSLKGHADSEKCAMQLFKADPLELFLVS